MKRFIIPCVLIQSKLLAAASATWISTSSSSMDTAGNWSPSGVPSNGTPLIFPPGPTGIQFTVSNDIGPFTLSAVSGTFPNSLSITNDGSTAYSISPSVASNIFLVPSSSTAQIVFGSSSGSLASNLLVPINLNSGTLNLIGSAAYDQISGGITGSGTLQVVGGTVQLSGTNTYTGATNINAGTLRLGTGSSLPSGTTLTVASGGIFNLNGQNQTFTAAPTINTGGVVQTGTGTLTTPQLSGSGVITINTGGTLNVINTGTNTFAGQLITGSTGAGGTFELGAGSTGTFTLSGANAYSTQTNIGYTTVTAGTLQSGNASAFGTQSNLTIASGAALNLNGNSSTFNTLSGAGTFTLGAANATISSGSSNTFSGQITGTGGSQLIYAGSDLLTLSGALNIPTLAISGGGTLNVANLSGITNSILFETTTNATLQFSTGLTGAASITLSSANANFDTIGNTVTLNGTISGGGSLTKAGSGTLILGGTGNAYTGGTIVSLGTVQISNANAYPVHGSTGTPLNIVNSGATFDMQGFSITISTLSGAGTLSMGAGTATVAVGGTAFSGAINGSGGFIYSGNATTLTLTGTNGYTGTTTINGTGTLNVVQSAFNTTTGLTFSGSGGTLQAGGSLTNSIPVTLSANGTIDTNGHACTFSGKVTGSSAFTKQGAGTLTLNSLTSDYSGQTNVFAGTLQAGSAAAFGSTSALNIKTGATIDLNGNSISLSQLLGDTGSSLLLGTGTLTLTGGVSTAPFYGVISQSGNVILNGGQPTFMGTNTYTGLTTIQGGASFNTATLNSTTGGVTFASGGGTLTIGSNTSTSSNFTLNDVATIATNTFNLTITGTITGSAHQFTKLGTGTLALNPSSTNSFATTPISMQGGTLEVTAKGLGTPASVTFQNFCGTMQIDEPLTTSSPIILSSNGTIDTNGNAVTISGNITNPTAASGLPSGGLGKSGAGVLTLTGTNYYTAPTTIYSGTINASSTSFPLPTMTFTPTLVFSGDGTGTFQAAGTFSSFPVVILNQSGTFDTNGNSVTLNNIIAGSSTSASLIKTGAGTLFLTAANLYTGPTIIDNGALNIIAASLPVSSGVEFSGTGNGILQAGGPIASLVNSVSFQQNGTIDTNGNNVTISGVLSGASGQSFTKAGAGTLTLSGANTYSGPTLVSAGTLRAGVATGNSGAFGENSAVTVSSGATLDFSTYNNSVGSITNNGNILSSATITTGTFSQSSTGDTTLNFLSSSASPVGNVHATGSISLGGGLTLTSTGGYSGGSNVILFQSSGSGKQLTGSFASTTLPFGAIQYDYSQNQVILTGGGSACNASWNQAGNGNWAVMGNWTSTGAACTPGISGNNDDSATLPTVGAATVVITLANSSGTAAQDVTLQYLDLNSASTSYTIQQYMGAGTITMEDTQSTKPILHSVAGTHTINAPIILNQDARFMISAGTLTLGSQTTISSSTGAWNLSEGSGTGTLYNNGMITPASLLIEGNTVENNATIRPTGALAISGLGGSAGATVNNHGTLASGATFLLGGSAGASTLSNDAGKTVSSVGAFTVDGGTGGATLTNNGTVSSGSTFTINSGTVTNNSGGLISSGSTFTIAGGTVANHQGATLGSSSADFVYTGGTLTSSDQLLAKDYTQGSSATIGLNFPTNAPSPVGNLRATGAVNLAGGLSVTSSYTPSGSAEVILFQSSGSGKQLQGSFSTTSLPAGSTLHYDYSDNEVILAFSAGCDGTWQSASNGNWGLMSNWTSCVPGTGSAMNNDTADFPTVGAPAVTVTLANSTGTGVQNITLHDLTFDSAATSYTIAEYMNMGTLTFAGTLTSKPRLTVNSGSHIIDAAISLPSQNVRFTLNSGSLTLGVNSSITSSASYTWYLSEGSSGGALNNHGTISPANVWIEGNVLNNAGAITPSGTFTLQGLGGINSPATLNNSTTLSSGGAFIVGSGAGPTLLNNSGTVTAGTTFTVGGGSGGTTLNNTGSISSGGAFTILSGTVTNNSNATLGSSTADLVFTGGALITGGNVLAENYTQGGSATLETGVFSLTHFGNVAASAVGALGGNLIVYAEDGITLANGDTINLVTAQGGRTSQFASVSFQNFPPSLIPSIVYLNNAVQLDIRGTNPTPVHGSTNSAIFNAVGQHNSFITLQMMHMRDRMKQPTGSLAGRFLPYSIDELLVQNEVIAQQPGIIQKTAQLSERIQKEGLTSSIYAGPVASFGNVKTKGTQLGLGYATAGGLAGIDTVVEDRETRGCRVGIGAIAEYRKIWSTIYDHGGSTSTDHVHGSIYATAIPKSMPNLAVEGIAGFAFNWDHFSRNTGIDLTSTAVGSTTEMIGDVLLGFEYTLSGDERTWLPCNFTIIPLMTWQYVVDKVASYTESGAGIYDLHYDSYTPMSLNSLLGARFQYLFRGSSADVRMEIDAGWQHEYLNRAFAVTATAFTITTGGFTTNAVAPGRNSLVAAIDLLTITNRGWTIEANSTYQYNSLYYDLFFYLGFGKEF